MYYITPIYGDAKLCKVFDIEPVVRTTLKESNETKDFQRQKKNVEEKFLRLLKEYKNNETPELKNRLENIFKDKERIENNFIICA